MKFFDGLIKVLKSIFFSIGSLVLVILSVPFYAIFLILATPIATVIEIWHENKYLNTDIFKEEC